MSSPRPLLGIALQPDERFLTHTRALVEEHAELFEVTPETLWGERCEVGPGYESMRELVSRCGRPVVGHGVLGSLGAAEPPQRRADWLAALRRDAAAFDMLWLSEHLGYADAAGSHVAWPVPLPPTDESVAVVARALEAMRGACPVVAFENNADLFCLGDPLAQPQFFAAICEAADAHLLLDLHNAYAFCRNVDVDLHDWLERIPWDRVIEIHLSGGHDSEPELLPSGRSLRMDSHDGAVPDEVWQAFENALPRAEGLRAVVLEWFPEAIDESTARVFADDFERARRILC